MRRASILRIATRIRTFFSRPARRELILSSAGSCWSRRSARTAKKRFSELPERKRADPCRYSVFWRFGAAWDFQAAFKGFGQNPFKTLIKTEFWLRFRVLGRSRALSYHFLAVSGSGLKVRRPKRQKSALPPRNGG